MFVNMMNQRTLSPKQITTSSINVQYEKYRDYYEKYFGNITTLMSKFTQDSLKNEIKVFETSEVFQKNCGKQKDTILNELKHNLEQNIEITSRITKTIKLHNQFEKYDIYELQNLSVDGINIEYVSIDNNKLINYDDIYFDAVHPIEYIAIMIALDKLVSNKSGVLVDILSKVKISTNIPDVHTVVLYKFDESIYVIDPNNSDFSEKLKNINPNIKIIEHGKLYLCEKEDLNYEINYRNCTDIASKILSCLMKVQNDIKHEQDIKNFVSDYTCTEFKMMHEQLKYITQSTKRFVSSWFDRVNYFNNYIVGIKESIEKYPYKKR